MQAPSRLPRTDPCDGTPTHHALDNRMLVREFSATLQPTATYLPGPRGVEYRRNDATGQTMWYLYDG
jgi:hypothetical protein